MSDNELNLVAVRKLIFKPDATFHYAVEAIKTACRLLDVDRVDYFGADDLPEDAHPDDSTTSGAVFIMLKSANLIVHSEHHEPGQGIVHGRRCSKQRSRNSAWISLWKLRNRAIADTFLKVHAAQRPISQQADFLTDRGACVTGRMHTLAAAVAGKLQEATVA